MRRLIFVLLSVVFVFSCNTAENNNDNSASEDSVIVKEKEKTSEKVELLLSSIQFDGMAQTKVTSDYKNNKLDLYICEGGLSKVSSEDVMTVDIPENAEQIISGFNAGLMTVIYIIEEDTKFVVYLVKVDEADGNPDKKVIAEYEKVF